jgi:hypothetical protein
VQQVESEASMRQITTRPAVDVLRQKVLSLPLLFVLLASLLSAAGCNGSNRPSELAPPAPIGTGLSDSTTGLPDEFVRSATEHVYAVNPVSFSNAPNCLGYGAAAGYGAIRSVDVTHRSDPVPYVMTLASGRLRGQLYKYRVSVEFSNGYRKEYPINLFEDAQSKMWYVDVNNCGVVALS